MSRILRDLLDAEEPQFSLSLRQLELASGQAGEDARLIGEIAHKMTKAIAHIGLDPRDSTDREIYRAMLAQIERDNKRVCERIGGRDPDNVREMIPLMIAAVETTKIPKTCWALKRSVAKKLLKKMPPKQLMKHLGYRSVDSMLKHEPIDELYTALRFSEGADWLNKYNELFKTVRPSDFEDRQISIVVMDHDKYVGLAEHFVQKKLHNITHTKEMGTIVVVPMHATHMKGITLKSLPLLFHYINEVRLYSAFFKLKQVSKNFGEVVVETLIADPGAAAQLAGQYIHWRVIQRYYGKPTIGVERTAEAFEPHVHPEDLHWRRAEENLTLIDPDMSFWVGLDYVARTARDGMPLTFNMMDVSLAYSNGERFETRYSYHFRESLWNEIFMRYMGNKNLEDSILKQLDNDSVAPESLSVNRRKPLVTAARQPEKNVPVCLVSANRKRELLVRKRLIDAAEGRMVGVVQEFENAFAILEKYDRTVTLFGSARLPQDSVTCQNAYIIAHRFAMAGYGVVTGGGCGVMEAANHGAFDAKCGGSIGFNIHLPTEQHLNPYVTDNYEFKHFFGRKVALTLDADGYVFFPGGFGTFDELFEITTLLQTGIVPPAPIVLFDSKYWDPLMKFIHTTLNTRYATIDSDDVDLFFVTDDVEEVFKLIDEKKVHSSQLKKVHKKGGEQDLTPRAK